MVVIFVNNSKWSETLCAHIFGQIFFFFFFNEDFDCKSLSLWALLCESMVSSYWTFCTAQIQGYGFRVFFWVGRGRELQINWGITSRSLGFCFLSTGILPIWGIRGVALDGILGAPCSLDLALPTDPYCLTYRLGNHKALLHIHSPFPI